MSRLSRIHVVDFASGIVIASEARQSGSTLVPLDCRVASLLAMTGGVRG